MKRLIALGLALGLVFNLSTSAQDVVGPIGPISGGGGETFTGGDVSDPTTFEDTVTFEGAVTIEDGASVINDGCLTLGTTVSTASPCLIYATAQTVDTGMLLTGTVSNHWVLAERGDAAFNFAHAQATNPTLFIHSAAQSTTQWLSLAHNGTDAVLGTGTGNVQVSTGLVVTANFLSGTYISGPAAGIGSGAGVITMQTTAQTPDTTTFGTGTAANSFIIAENGDTGFDFAHAQATDPTLFIHSHNQNTTQWVGLTHNGTDAVISTGAGNLNITSASLAVKTQAIILQPDYPLWLGSVADTQNLITQFTVGTPDQTLLGTGTTSNAWVIAETRDRTFDFAHAAATNPTLFIHSTNQSTTQWISLTHDGSVARVGSGTDYIYFDVSATSDAQLGGGSFDVTTGNKLMMGDVGFDRVDTGRIHVNASGSTTSLGYILQGQYTVANTGTATPAIKDSGTVYTNTGDADGSQVTLPNDPTIGTTFTIVGTAAFNITVAPSAGETVMFGNTVCGTSLVVSGVATGIGDSLTVIAATGGSGAVWITTASAGTPVCTP